MRRLSECRTLIDEYESFTTLDDPYLSPYKADDEILKMFPPTALVVSPKIKPDSYKFYYCQFPVPKAGGNS